MGIGDKIGNFDLGRLTIVDWLIFLLSPIVGGICVWQFIEFMTSKGVDFNQPTDNHRRRPADYIIFAVFMGPALGFFFAAKFAFNAAGITLVKPPKDDS